MPTTWQPREVTGGATRVHAPDPAGPPFPASPEADEQGSLFTVRSPERTLDEVILDAGTRQRVEQVLARIVHHDTLMRDWQLGRIARDRLGVAINLYGPPGTGKTLCAEAIAHRLGRRLLVVSYAELESRYVGETPKNIVRAFRAAAEGDAVMVFDEADSVLGKRLTEVTQSADHAVNVSRSVMLTELDRFTGVVVFTSNLPGNYDPAFVRRLLAHVELAPPDHETLVRLWDHLVPPAVPRTDDLTGESVAEAAVGLTGGDLVNVVLGAAAAAVGRPEDHRRVTLDDVRQQIGHVRQARRVVGTGPRQRTVSLTRVDPALVDQLDPPDQLDRPEG